MRSSNPDEVPMPDTIISSTSFWAFSASFLRFVSSRRSSDEEMLFLAKDSRNYVQVGSHVSDYESFPLSVGRSPVRMTYHLELVLPELLLLRLVEKWKVAHMVDEDVSEYREIRVERGYLSKIGLEGGAESAQGSRGVQLGDFTPNLLREELSLEI